MLDLLLAQWRRVGLGEGATGISKLPIAALGTAGIAGTLEPIVRPPRAVLVGGLATGDGLLPLRFTEAQGLGSRFVGLTRRGAFWVGGEKTQDGFDELVVGRHGHGSFAS